MNVFVSQPMKGKTDAEIITTREKIFMEYQSENPEAILLDSYEWIKKGMGTYQLTQHPPVAMLAEAIGVLADADVVLFAKGWENHPGCRIEERVATYYDIPRVYVK